MVEIDIEEAEERVEEALRLGLIEEVAKEVFDRC